MMISRPRLSLKWIWFTLALASWLSAQEGHVWATSPRRRMGDLWSSMEAGAADSQQAAE